MNKIILLTILIGLNVYVQHAHAISPMLAWQIQAQEKQRDLKMQLQNQKIENLQNQVDKAINHQALRVDKAINHQALRKALLDRQENSIDWWLSVLGIILTFFTIVVPIAMWFFKIRADKHISRVDKYISQIKEKTQEAKQYVNDIKVMKDDTINAQKNAEHPEDTKTIIKKAKEQGTELDKLIASAFELQNQKSIEKAIDKWREILQQAYQINNQNLQASCYFNLGYLYDDNNKFWDLYT